MTQEWVDEPTAAFSIAEVERLFGIVRRLKARGLAMIFVSHRLEEVLSLSNRVVAMSRGRVIGDKPAGEFSMGDLIDLIAGRRIEHVEEGAVGAATAEPSEVVLSLRDVGVAPKSSRHQLDRRSGRDRRPHGARRLGADRAAQRPLGRRQPAAGNQQKGLVARWLLIDPDIYLLDEPTEGVDVAGRQEIYDVLRGLAELGKSILVTSSDVEKVVDQCSRIYVMREGTIANVLQGAEAGLERVHRVSAAKGRTCRDAHYWRY